MGYPLLHYPPSLQRCRRFHQYTEILQVLHDVENTLFATVHELVHENYAPFHSFFSAFYSPIEGFGEMGRFLLARTENHLSANWRRNFKPLQMSTT